MRHACIFDEVGIANALEDRLAALRAIQKSGVDIDDALANDPDSMRGQTLSLMDEKLALEKQVRELLEPNPKSLTSLLSMVIIMAVHGYGSGRAISKARFQMSSLRKQKRLVYPLVTMPLGGG